MGTASMAGAPESGDVSGMCRGYRQPALAVVEWAASTPGRSATCAGQPARATCTPQRAPIRKSNPHRRRTAAHVRDFLIRARCSDAGEAIETNATRCRAGTGHVTPFCRRFPQPGDAAREPRLAGRPGTFETAARSRYFRPMSRLASIVALIAGTVLLAGCAGGPPDSAPIDWQVDLGDPGYGDECSDEFVEAHIEAAAAEGITLERESDLDFAEFDEYVVAVAGNPWCAFWDDSYFAIEAIYLTDDWESFLDTLRDSGLSVNEIDTDRFFISAGDEIHVGGAYPTERTPELKTESIVIRWSLAGE